MTGATAIRRAATALLWFCIVVSYAQFAAAATAQGSLAVREEPADGMRMVQLNVGEDEDPDDPDADPATVEPTRGDEDAEIPPKTVKGSVKVNGEVHDVECDCSDNWQDALVAEHTKSKKPSCTTPTKFKIQRIDSQKSIVEGGLDAGQVREFIGLPSSLNFVNVQDYPMSDMDGRTKGETLSTPGGDEGEFLLAVAVYSHLLGKDFTEPEVIKFLEAYLESIKPRKFYMHSSVDAVNTLREEFGQQLDLANPGEESHQNKLLGEDCQSSDACGLMDPNNMGNDHMKLIMENEGKYAIPTELTQNVVKALYKTLWKGNEQMELDFLKVKRLHNEKAVVAIQVSDACTELQQYPLLSQEAKNISGQDSSIFALHPDAAAARRQEYAEFFEKLDTSNKVKAEMLQDGIESLALRGFEKTLLAITGNPNKEFLPVYRVWVL